MNQLLITIAETARSWARAEGVDCHAGLHLRPQAHERASGRRSGSGALHEVREEDGAERMGQGRLTHTHIRTHINTNKHKRTLPPRARTHTRTYRVARGRSRVEGSLRDACACNRRHTRTRQGGRAARQ